MDEKSLRTRILMFSALLLGLVALLHLARLFFPFPVIIGTYSVPEWASVVAFLITGVFSGLLLSLIKE